ncbi:MAG: hypothetical protein WC755_05230 [Candidatus Woesearchaeota archaeon]|jgi:hypothetical protein
MVINESMILGVGIGIINLVIGVILFFLKRLLAKVPLWRQSTYFGFKSAEELAGSEKGGIKGIRLWGILLMVFGLFMLILGIISGLTGFNILNF